MKLVYPLTLDIIDKKKH